jgi:hypothetical protein
MNHISIRIKDYDVLVSECDFERVNQHNWYKNVIKGVPYFAYKTPKPEHKNILLHRFLVDCPTGKCVDHINGNTLDNRRENLRICTQAENRYNSRKSKSNTSGYKGVSYSNYAKKWRSQIKRNNKIIHLGYFETPEKAYEAYVAASKKYHGEFGRIV